MLGDRDQCWQEELLDFEHHSVFNLLQIVVQEHHALLLLKDVVLSKLLNYDQDCDFGFLYNLFCFLALVRGADAIHHDLDYLHHQTLSLLLGDVLLAQVQQRVNPFNLDWLVTQHEHPGRQWEYVDGDNVDNF